VARAASAAGVEALAVASPGEIRQLREAGIGLPVLFMSSPLAQEIPELAALDAEVFAGDRGVIEALAGEGRRQGRPVRVHLKVDTGMARNGCSPEEAGELGEMIHQNPHLTFAGLCTHLASGSEDQNDFLDRQKDLFFQARQEILLRGCRFELCHAASSWAILSRPDLHLDMVRPGIMAYGYYPGPELQDRICVVPALTLKTRVVALRDIPMGAPVSYGMTWRAPEAGRLATLRIGYGDGYPRSLSNRGEVVIRGRRCPVAGRVCMDHIMAFLGREVPAAVGDAAYLFGPGALPTAWDLAAAAGTIPYEILTGLGPRVARTYPD
jgi:alanine racemase